MVRAFWSELIKLRRWSVLAGGAAMIVALALWSYSVVIRATSGAAAPALAATLSTTKGLVTMLAAAEPFIAAIAICIVAANIAAEWSQGTLRNLLVREPGRLRWLSGKLLALLVGAGLILAVAPTQRVSTSLWTDTDGVNTFLIFFGNELLGVVGISLLGVFIAVLTRSASAAVGISLAYVLVGETLVDLVCSDGAEWLPAHVFGYLPGTASPMGFGPAPQGYDAAFIVALLWMVGFLLVSLATLRFRDVSV